MENENTENLDSTNETMDEFSDLNSDTDTNEQSVEESADDTSEVDKLAEQNKKLFERAKKAETELKELKAKKPETETKVEAPKEQGITPLDMMAFINAKITDPEDIQEVLDYAKFKGLDVNEALKSPTVKSILLEKAEVRKTAEATNTGSARKSPSKPSPEQIIADVESGKAVDPEALADARMAQKLKK